MSIDVSKIKVGDVLLLRTVVMATDTGDTHFPLRVKSDLESKVLGMWIHHSLIEKHIPTPRVFVKGDRVKSRRTSARAHTFITAVEEHAICRTDAGHIVAVCPMIDLQHAE